MPVEIVCETDALTEDKERGIATGWLPGRLPWRNRDAVEMATLEWVDWYNNRRLFRPWATSHRPRENRPTRPP